MGIYDREYYRGETRGSLWLSGTAPVCRALIVINVAVFVLPLLGICTERQLFDWFSATSDGIFQHGRVWELLTATFLHANVLHLLGNMLFLWVVGREIEAMPLGKTLPLPQAGSLPRGRRQLLPIRADG